MRNYSLNFNLNSCNELDNYALLSCQKYNLGNKTDWFGSFRGGLYAMYARVHCVSTHYLHIHSWIPARRTPTDVEYELSSIFFGMDSAIECCVFALNALGSAVEPSMFFDVANEKQLRQIAPWNVLGDPNRVAKPGYRKLFPAMTSHFLANRDLIEKITEQHDVSKHRSTIYSGGKYRSDAPRGFFESLGISEDKGLQYQFSPMEEIILRPEPKKPSNEKTPSQTYEELDTLEGIAESFSDFIGGACELALQDARLNISLPHSDFLQTRTVVCHADINLYEDEECTKKRDDVVGLISGIDYIGYEVCRGGISPTRRAGYYLPGREICEKRNLDQIWNETWYIDPDDGIKKAAWHSASEFIGDVIESSHDA